MKEGVFTRFARAALDAGKPIALISIEKAEGSTPRDSGTVMMVTPDATAGTIGGGRLEWDAIAAARECLAGRDNRKLVIPLGPETGQCCGGRVTLEITRVAEIGAAIEVDFVTEIGVARRLVVIFGAGHVGAALARALAPLPMRVRLVDQRSLALANMNIEHVECVETDRLTREVETAPAGSAFVVLTHSHALDSLIVAAALERGDFCYLGLIGSKTKRRVFENAFREIGIAEERIQRIVCPIGSRTVRDKRPEVIAALVAAEIIEAQAAAMPSLRAKQSNPGVSAASSGLLRFARNDDGHAPL